MTQNLEKKKHDKKLNYNMTFYSEVCAVTFPVFGVHWAYRWTMPDNSWHSQGQSDGPVLLQAR